MAIQYVAHVEKVKQCNLENVYTDYMYMCISIYIGEAGGEVSSFEGKLGGTVN